MTTQQVYNPLSNQFDLTISDADAAAVAALSASLTTTQIAALATVAGGSLTTTQMATLTTAELAAVTTTALAGLTSTQISAIGITDASININSVGSPTDTTLQSAITHMWSTGMLDGGALTNNGATVDIAACDFMVRQGTNEDDPLATYRIAAQAGLALTDDDVNWIFLNYNSGSPVWQVGTAITDFNGIDKVVAYCIGRNTDGTPHNHILDLRGVNVDSNRKLRRMLFEFDGFVANGFYRSREAASPLSASGLNPVIGAGKYFFFNTIQTHPALDCSASDTFEYFYNRASWTRVAAQSTINNAQYDLNGVLTTMNNNYYRRDWIYIVPDSGDTHLVAIMGASQYNSLAAAQAAPLPSSLPPQIAEIAILVGQIIVQKSASSVLVTQAGSTTFTGATASDHANLANLQGGTSGEYYHLTAAQTAGLNALSTTQVASLGSAQIGALTTTQLGYLTTTQIASMGLIRVCTPAQALAATTTQIADLQAGTNGKVLTANTGNVPSWSTPAAGGLTITQVAALSSAKVF